MTQIHGSRDAHREYLAIAHWVYLSTINLPNGTSRYFAKLQCGFEGSPVGAAVVFGDVDTDLVARFGLKVSDAGEQNAVFFAGYIYKIMTIFEFERANYLLARNWTDLLVQKGTIVGDGKL